MNDMKIEPAEYERMRSWLSYMVPRVLPPDQLDSAADPVTVLDQIASKSIAKARSGLAMAIGDIVDFTSGWSEAEVTGCNEELSHRRLPTLTEVQSRFSKIVQRAVRCRCIKSAEEFYAVRNAVEQPDADESILWPLLEAYANATSSSVRSRN